MKFNWTLALKGIVCVALLAFVIAFATQILSLIFGAGVIFSAAAVWFFLNNRKQNEALAAFLVGIVFTGLFTAIQ